MNKKKRLNLYLFLSILVAFMVGITSPVFAVDWRHVGVPGDTYGKRIDLQGDTPALLFSDGQDTYAFWQKSTGELLLELFQDTDVLEVDTRGRVTIFKTPTADSDAATKKYVDANTGGGGGNPTQTIQAPSATLGGGDTLTFHQFNAGASDTIAVLSSHVTPDTTNTITGLEVALRNVTDGVDIYTDTEATLAMNADKSALATSSTVGGDRLRFMVRNDSGDTRDVSASIEVRVNRP